MNSSMCALIKIKTNADIIYIRRRVACLFYLKNTLQDAAKSFHEKHTKIEKMKNGKNNVSKRISR